MNDPRMTTGASSPAELAAIEAALGDLVLDEPAEIAAVQPSDEEVIVEAPMASDDEVVIEAAKPVDETIVLDERQAMELETAIARDETYAEEKPAGDIVADVGAAAEAAAAPAPAAAPKAPRAASTPRAPRDLSALPPEAFVLTTEEPADMEANKKAVIASAPTQKKIAEKFENILLSVAAGKRPSTYTMDCFAILKAKGEVTQGDLVKGLMSITRHDGKQTYTEGTARSQAGQIMTLFAALKIATRTGQTLKLNPDSTLAMALEALTAAPATAAEPTEAPAAA